jgi:hypothetical protein
MRALPSLLKRMLTFYAWQLITMCCPGVLQVKDWTSVIEAALSDLEGTDTETAMDAFLPSARGFSVRNIFPEPVAFVMNDIRYETYNELERRGIVVVDLPMDSRLDIFKYPGRELIFAWLAKGNDAKWVEVFETYTRRWIPANDPTGVQTHESHLDSTSGVPALRKSLTLLESELKKDATVPGSILKGFKALIELLLHNPLVWTCWEVFLSNTFLCMLTRVLWQMEPVLIQFLQTLFGCQDQMVHFDEFPVPVHRRRLPPTPERYQHFGAIIL